MRMAERTGMKFAPDLLAIYPGVNYEVYCHAKCNIGALHEGSDSSVGNGCRHRARRAKLLELAAYYRDRALKMLDRRLDVHDS